MTIGGKFFSISFYYRQGERQIGKTKKKTKITRKDRRNSFAKTKWVSILGCDYKIFFEKGPWGEVLELKGFNFEIHVIVDRKIYIFFFGMLNSTFCTRISREDLSSFNGNDIAKISCFEFCSCLWYYGIVLKVPKIHHNNVKLLKL